MNKKTKYICYAIVIVLLAALLALLLFRCGKEEDRLTMETLHGKWYADLEGDYITIFFDTESGKYTTENYVCEGEFQIAKDQTVKLIDDYRDIHTLFPQHTENGEWALVHKGEFFSYSFTREPRAQPDTNISATESFGDMEVIASGISHILEDAPWPLENGDSLTFANGALSFKNGLSEGYVFEAATISMEGYEFSLRSSTGDYNGTIYPITDDTEEEPVAYKLVLQHNGGESLCSIREGAVSFATDKAGFESY